MLREIDSLKSMREDFISASYSRSPEESKARIMDFLRSRHPDMTESALERFIG